MFLFIAYKPNSSDYCKGCHMASYSSDFETKNMLNSQELTEFWSEYLFKNLNLECNEEGYSFYIYKDGIQVWNENYCRWDGGERFVYDSDEYWINYTKLEEQEKEDNEEISGIWAKANELANKKQQSKKEAEQAKLIAENQKIANDALERRRKEFEKLKQEFEINGK